MEKKADRGTQKQKSKKEHNALRHMKAGQDFRLEAGGAEVYAEIRPPATSWPLIFPIILAL